MQSKKEYLQALLGEQGYHLRTKKEKSKLLTEYCKNTGLNRKYVIRKIQSGRAWTAPTKRQRKQYYDSHVIAALAKVYDIFDHPCGQRLVPLLKTEVNKLRKLKELQCSDEVAKKLMKLSFRSVDEKLKHHKEEARLKAKYKPKVNPLLYQRVPVKTFAEQDRTTFGLIQADQVEHCGRSVTGEYILSLNTTDIAHGWWEGSAHMGKSQIATFNALKANQARFPLVWTELHPDNGMPILNDLIYRYCKEQNISYSRSRPYKKNDNCLVEQKNWTHIRKKIGYLRFDTPEELNILNDLYSTEYRLFKNFFQPCMKLKEKVRIGGKLKRRYDIPKTPYHRILDDKNVQQEVKEKLTQEYEQLNPAELQRQIDRKLRLLYQAYLKKTKQMEVEPPVIRKKLIPTMVTFLTAQPESVLVT